MAGGNYNALVVGERGGHRTCFPLRFTSVIVCDFVGSSIWNIRKRYNP